MGDATMDIDPFKYGALTEKVEYLEKKIDKLEVGMEQLLELANRSRGGLWVGMSLASFFGALITYVTSWIFHKL